MPKQGEIDYLDNLDAESVAHAAAKPWSDPGCGQYLVEIGTILSLLPPPPARLLDLGCGTGWTSRMFAQRGYDVVGQDIAPSMIELARAAPPSTGRVDFVVSDYETLPYEGTFDIAVFYDALHHAVDEAEALAGAARALRPGGLLVTVEPGVGHARAEHSRRAVDDFGV
ncbi:MAG: class I SAM-dependent methyltransferase, partial [Acidimicrobiia bacterium]|nr:class I SAM-dependent methyltransferase [Acidimicrobiia bacterium]